MMLESLEISWGRSGRHSGLMLYSQAVDTASGREMPRSLGKTTSQGCRSEPNSIPDGLGKLNF